MGIIISEFLVNKPKSQWLTRANFCLSYKMVLMSLVLLKLC